MNIEADDPQLKYYRRQFLNLSIIIVIIVIIVLMTGPSVRFHWLMGSESLPSERIVVLGNMLSWLTLSDILIGYGIFLLLILIITLLLLVVGS